MVQTLFETTPPQFSQMCLVKYKGNPITSNPENFITSNTTSLPTPNLHHFQHRTYAVMVGWGGVGRGGAGWGGVGRCYRPGHLHVGGCKRPGHLHIGHLHIGHTDQTADHQVHAESSGVSSLCRNAREDQAAEHQDHVEMQNKTKQQSTQFM